MANVEGAASGVGGAGWPISGAGDTTPETVESGPDASRQGTNPAFAGLPGETGAGWTAAFWPAAHERLLKTKRFLSDHGYTDQQIADVETRHGEPGLESLRGASAISSDVAEQAMPAYRQRMIKIALGEDGLNVLRAISQHSNTLLDFHKGILAREILDLAEQRDGATKVTRKAQEIEGLLP